MKAVVEIELEIAGEYLKSDNEAIEMAICDSIDSIWFIDEDRLDILARSVSCKIKGKP